MDILIAAIGRQKQGPELDLLKKYIKQTRWKVTVSEFEDKKSGTVQERIQREGEMLLAAVPAGAILVALDERGKMLSSTAFAEQLEKWQDSSFPTVAFLIGGADGHSEEVRQKAHMLLAFGTMTWPHMMVRAMLAEQIYRARSIIDGHPYHRA